ncbi:MAG: hypothetical protein M3081_17545 [Gemmatimonadota bacterium]|nr:hypothetical protein [Gemmatimonadota bacterium]
MRLWRLLLRATTRLFSHGDPWEKFEYEVPNAMFGHGSLHDFRWYFGGDSAVQVQSVDHICEWLIACEYASDSALFHEPDYWQHPRTFEELRKGDCEDHALWAWRKLVELGHDTHLMIGKWTPPGGQPGDHAWVTFEKDGVGYILEGVRKRRETMILRLDDVRAHYEPMFSVDHNFTRYAYTGYLKHVHALLLGRGKPRRVPERSGPIVVPRGE